MWKFYTQSPVYLCQQVPRHQYVYQYISTPMPTKAPWLSLHPSGGWCVNLPSGKNSLQQFTVILHDRAVTWWGLVQLSSAVSMENSSPAVINLIELWASDISKGMSKEKVRAKTGIHIVYLHYNKRVHTNTFPYCAQEKKEIPRLAGIEYHNVIFNLEIYIVIRSKMQIFVSDKNQCIYIHQGLWQNLHHWPLFKMRLHVYLKYILQFQQELIQNLIDCVMPDRLCNCKCPITIS